MKGAIALAIVGAALLAVAGSQPWWVISQGATSGNGYYSSSPARSIEYSLNDFCANESSGSYSYYGYYGCISYENGGPYGVRGVARGVDAAASIAFALALAEAALIGVAALWPRTSAASRWAGVLSIAFAAAAIALFTALIPGKAAPGFPGEWGMNLFFGSHVASGDRVSWGAGAGWYLALVALLVLVVAFIRAGQARRYLESFPPVRPNEIFGAAAQGGARPASWPPGLATGGRMAPAAGAPPTPNPPRASVCANCRAPLTGPVCSVCGTVNS